MLRGRYAPSPTGFLHLGNARTAIVAWLSARSRGGTFVLRVEDLDSQRSRPEFIRANVAELRWLGLDWDEGPDVGGPFAPYLQSERHGLYQAALERLEPHLFACYLSRKDLQEIASAPHGEMPPYGQRERALNARLSAQKRAEGKTPSLRFRVDEAEVTFADALQGVQKQTIGDFVVRRADGEWAYQLAVVVDDLAMRVTEVLRGADLLQSTAAQRLLYRALGETPPTFAHVPLLLDETGERMSKRKGSLTLTALKEQGVRPERVVGLLAYSLGLVPSLKESASSDLRSEFDIATAPGEAFQLEPAHLAWLGG